MSATKTEGGPSVRGNGFDTAPVDHSEFPSNRRILPMAARLLPALPGNRAVQESLVSHLSAALGFGRVVSSFCANAMIRVGLWKYSVIPLRYRHEWTGSNGLLENSPEG